MSEALPVTVSRLGFIETDMTADLKEEWKKQMLETIPLKRFGKAEEVADAVVF